MLFFLEIAQFFIKQFRRLEAEHSEASKLPSDTQRSTRTLMIASEIASLLLLIPWGCLATFAVMIGWPKVIEAEGGWDLLAYSFSSMLFYPALAVVAIVIPRKLYNSRRYLLAAITSILPLLVTAVLFSLWIYADQRMGQ